MLIHRLQTWFVLADEEFWFSYTLRFSPLGIITWQCLVTSRLISFANVINCQEGRKRKDGIDWLTEDHRPCWSHRPWRILSELCLCNEAIFMVTPGWRGHPTASLPCLFLLVLRNQFSPYYLFLFFFGFQIKMSLILWKWLIQVKHLEYTEK